MNTLANVTWMNNIRRQLMHIPPRGTLDKFLEYPARPALAMLYVEQ